ncbi:MAG: hypothetical protein Fur0012_03380 [Elusimicrobiota bacterium]
MSELAILFFFFLPASASVPPNQEKLLELSYQSFVYTKDLSNAYALASKAAKLYPENPEWKNRLAQICIWTGRQMEAIEIYEKLYSINHDSSQIEPNLPVIKQSRPAFYEKILSDKLKSNYSDKDMIRLLRFYRDNGEKEKASSLLATYGALAKDGEIFKEAVLFWLENGNSEKAIFWHAKSANTDTCSFYLDIAKIQFSHSKFSSARDILASNIDRCRLSSQFSWLLADTASLLNDFETDIKARESAYQSGMYREIDAERLFQYYYKRDRAKAAKISLSAYKKFSKRYFFYMYLSCANSASEKLRLINDFSIPFSQEDFPFYIYLENFDFLAAEQKSFLSAKAAVSADESFLASYFWAVAGKGTQIEKRAAAMSFSCSFLKTPEALTALSFLKFSAYMSKEALGCFSLAARISKPSSALYMDYGNFLESAGFTDEASFYRKKAYDSYLENPPSDEEGKMRLLRLAMEFSQQPDYAARLSFSGINGNEYAEMMLSYFSSKDLYEMMQKFIAESQFKPAWAELSLFLHGLGNPNFEADYSKINPAYLSYFYQKSRQQSKAIETSWTAMENAPDSIALREVWRQMAAGSHSYSTFSSEYENRSSSEKKEAAASISFPRPTGEKIAFNFSSGEINFLSRNDFLRRNMETRSAQISISNSLWAIHGGWRRQLKDIYNASFTKKWYVYGVNMLSLINFHSYSADTFLLEIGGYENSISQEFSIKAGRKSSISTIFSFKDYHDQKGIYLGKGSIAELSFIKKDRFFSLRPYLREGSYSSAPYSSHSLIKIFSAYDNSRSVPENFKEAGIAFSFFETERFRPRWSFPAEFSISHNSSTHFNYSAFIKALRAIRKAGDISLSAGYSKGSSTNRDSLFSCKAIFNFR